MSSNINRWPGKGRSPEFGSARVSTGFAMACITPTRILYTGPRYVIFFRVGSNLRFTFLEVLYVTEATGSGAAFQFQDKGRM